MQFQLTHKKSVKSLIILMTLIVFLDLTIVGQNRSQKPSPFQSSLNHLQDEYSTLHNDSLPYHTFDSPTFGSDIVIRSQPSCDQRNLSICSAFNGYLFAAFSYDSIGPPCICIMQSKDNGVTWTKFLDIPICLPNEIITRVALATIGNSLETLKVILGIVLLDTTVNHGPAIVWRISGQTGTIQNNFLYGQGDNVKDLALTTDFENSINGVIGVLLIEPFSTSDSLIFLFSTNGGAYVSGRRCLTHSSFNLRKITLGFGRSPQSPFGRFFAAWEHKANQGSDFGHIFESHSDTSFGLPFSIPICLDSLSNSSIGLVRNPTIACQNNLINNDSSGLTELILCERYNQTTGKTQIIEYKTLKGLSNYSFSEFELTSPNLYSQHPFVSFNIASNSFILTYFDKSGSKIPEFENSFNLPNPTNWNLISPAINDNNSISVPEPVSCYNYDLHAVVTAWINESTDAKGVALFDAPYFYFTSTDYQINNLNDNSLIAYPNPCQNLLNLRFIVDKSTQVKICLVNIKSNYSYPIINEDKLPGVYTFQVNTTDFEKGMYFLLFSTHSKMELSKIILYR